MNKWILAASLAAFISLGFVACADAAGKQKTKKPNIIFILADDLGYGDVGCYGQEKIKTPNIDKLAKQGMRFTQAYAGSTVCAPSRCTLMTGKHTGHARIRGNGRVPLLPGDVTIAEILKRAGYTTGLIGKWGLGEAGSSGVPNKQGFDYFYGYLNQHHAHNYYPDFLWRNQKKVELPNVVPKNNIATKRVAYSHDLITDEAFKFVKKNKDKTFFMYLAYTIPHANNERGRIKFKGLPDGMEVPSDEPYSKKDWPIPQKNHAAMITRMDRDIGRLMELLENLGLAENTIVFFSSDNGPHREGGANPNFFNSSGPLRGYKRSLHEGGIRVPMIVVWKGKIPANSTSDLQWAFWDFLPTAAEFAGEKAPKDIDGISIVPTLLKKKGQKQHKYLYWEFHERGFAQGLRMGKWKAVKLNKQPVQLYNLGKDIHEDNNIAKQRPKIAAQIETLLREARTDSKAWPVRYGRKRKKKAQKG